jgi:two-component system phosphate regulon sensor histidine kinase PhoR
LPYLLLILASVSMVSWFGLRTYRDINLKQLKSGLESNANIMRHSLPLDLSISNRDSVETLCVETGHSGGIRVTVILPDGTVLGESERNPEQMDDHRSRPEIMAALQGNIGSSDRYSNTLHTQMHYTAVPVIRDGKVIAIVRTAVSADSVDEAMNRMYVRVGTAGLLIVLLAALLSYFIARRLQRMLQQMRSGAERFAKSDLQSHLAVPDVEELAALSRAMNEMAAQLDTRIRSEVNQREEQEAVLTGMVEGVLALDLDERIIMANEAAAKMLDFRAENAKGRFVQEIIRNAEVQQFMKRAMDKHPEHLADFISIDNGNRILQASASVICDSLRNPRGTVVVFNDITRMRKLEMTRREFVANVSHELKTPITSIKGYVETLRDSGPMSNEERERFLEIIAKKADQLTAVIDDLLALARIERETDADLISKERCEISDILKSATLMCENAAHERGQKISLNCPDDLSAIVNSRLIEQAIINLIDNAVKYGKVGGMIEVSAARENNSIVIRVKDDGPGISSEHFPRLFERFYRVDLSRSRAFGGTGLGLAIVKHIALAHGGTATVESTVGKGSGFEIRVPGEKE